VGKSPIADIPGADSFNWIIAPAGRCVSLVGEETGIAALIQRAVVALAHQGPLLELARRELATAKASEDGIAALIAEQQPLANAARDLIDVDFHPINVHGIIGLWVAVEVAVEDTAVLILLNDPTTLTLVEAAGVKTSTDSGPPADAARRIFHRLERHSRRDRRVGEAYCHLLAILRISVAMTPEVGDVFSELNYVRNCLLHRAGIADERVKTEAPLLDIAPGAPVKISSARYLRYFDSVRQFAVALLNATVESPYVRVGAYPAP
jgi:hypothetical protein